jgi:hypothetical protein
LSRNKFSRDTQALHLLGDAVAPHSEGRRLTNVTTTEQENIETVRRLYHLPTTETFQPS